MILAAIPVIIAFSLCYAATRHENVQAIFKHAASFGGWLMFAFVLVAVILELVYRYLH
ncbi:MAG: hypothetical protein LBT46_10510 [Planctomycetaceae bacterium]|jgi:hypothetical protein|nr:hypothetical protein [Planctomycetaceae bacterium]